MNVKIIETEAFTACYYLRNVIFGENGSITIANRAFEQCYALSQLTIPESVVAIGANAFEGCVFLNAIIPPLLLILTMFVMLMESVIL